MNEDEWRKNEWRCSHGWLRGEQCEICNAPKREWVDLTPQDYAEIFRTARNVDHAARLATAKLKEKNYG